MRNSGPCCGTKGTFGPSSPDQALTSWRLLLSDPHCTDCCPLQILGCLPPGSNSPWLRFPHTLSVVIWPNPSFLQVKGSKIIKVPQEIRNQFPLQLQPKSLAETSDERLFSSDRFLLPVERPLLSPSPFRTCSVQPGLVGWEHLLSAGIFPLAQGHCLPGVVHAVKFFEHFLQYSAGAENEGKASRRTAGLSEGGRSRTHISLACGGRGGTPLPGSLSHVRGRVGHAWSDPGLQNAAP